MLPRPAFLDEVGELTAEEKQLAARIKTGRRRRELIKCRGEGPLSDNKGDIFYMVVDDSGGYQFNSIEELREFVRR